MCLARNCPNLEAINLHECRVLILLTPQIRMLRKERQLRVSDAVAAMNLPPTRHRYYFSRDKTRSCIVKTN